jgi:hypothetical protein
MRPSANSVLFPGDWILFLAERATPLDNTALCLVALEI